MSAETTRDAFLGGQVTLVQPRQGYRAGTDPVLLAASVCAKAGDRVLDLGCGVGAAALCLYSRVPGLKVVGVEVQPDLAAMAAQNALENTADFKVVTADLTDLPADIRDSSFDHVLMNPPFYDHHTDPSPLPGKDKANRASAEGVSLWLDAALKRLRPGGSITVIYRTEGLPMILSALHGRAGAIRVLPLAARGHRPADRVIVQALKGRSTPLVLLPPFVLHDGATHKQDGEGFSDAAEAILRRSAPLSLT